MECTIHEVACTVTIDPLPPWDWNLCILLYLVPDYLHYLLTGATLME